jgi:hypothetical protein
MAADAHGHCGVCHGGLVGLTAERVDLAIDTGRAILGGPGVRVAPFDSDAYTASYIAQYPTHVSKVIFHSPGELWRIGEDGPTSGTALRLTEAKSNLIACPFA